VIHSAGTEEEAALAGAAYARIGIPHAARAFIAEMGDALRTADLVLCRGGASTLAEVAALGRPAVVVPYPHHADRQQWKNAAPLVAAGRAVLVEEGDLDPARFRAEVVGRLLAEDPLPAAGAPDPAVPSGGDPAATIARELVRSIPGAAPLPGDLSPRGGPAPR
jgi:UDP-N-acetylglucosamine--N-acetylmuramyl-(pentapeptide) pyrophosphoryl-undecaprenol N-acetylglucosamine transferase